MSKCSSKMTRSLQSAADRIVIGRLGAPRGLNGEMKLIPLTDFADRFDDLETVAIDGRDFRIDYVKSVGNAPVIRFDGVNNRDAARSLTDKLLTVDRKDAAPLEDGEYYTFDIIGLDVLDLDGKKLGAVENVLKTGSNDVFVTRTLDGGELLIPALKRVVREINIAGGTLTIDESTLEEV